MDTKILPETKSFFNNHNALVAIQEFLSQQLEYDKILKGEFFSEEEAIIANKENILAIEKEKALIAIELIRVRQRYLFVYRTIITKLKYLTKAIIYGLNSKNLLVFANTTRSIIEHAATICYLTTKGNQLIENLYKKLAQDQITNTINEFQDTLTKLFYGSKFFKEPGLVDAIHINDLLTKYLSKEIPDLMNAYNYLSDFVHPNFGSSLIITEGDLGEGQIDPDPKVKSKITDTILSVAKTIYEYLEQEVFKFAKIGIDIDNYLEKTFRNLKINPTPSLAILGDGKNKETAIIFRKANTHTDFVTFQYKYLESIGAEIISQQFGGFDDEYFYDIQKTSKGEFWFKLPKAKSDFLKDA